MWKEATGMRIEDSGTEHQCPKCAGFNRANGTDGVCTGCKSAWRKRPNPEGQSHGFAAVVYEYDVD